MQSITLRKIINFSKAKLKQGKSNLEIEDIVIDSRKVKKKYLFIAIVGENKDGHDYLKEAVDNGAAAVIVDKNFANDLIMDSDTAVLQVENTTKALQDIAHNYRMSFSNLKVIAVTGSAGKTTTKDLIHSVINQKYNCLKTNGNYNNHIGVPLTLLRLTGSEDYAVVEMGMSNLGEIDLLAKIAAPEIGVVTNVAAAHLKQLGSLEKIAQAKKELIDNLQESELAILNYDNNYTRKMGENTAAEVIYFGFADGADLKTKNYDYDQEKEILRFDISYKNSNYSLKFNKAGKYNIYNAMAAVIIGFKLGLMLEEIQVGLLKTKFSSLRMEFLELKNDVKIINDSYNANPLAVKAALDVLAAKKGKRKIAVLASMLELGKQSALKHQEVGEYIAAGEIDILVTIGEKAKEFAIGAALKNSSVKVISLANKKEAVEFLKNEIEFGDLILFKGSRANKLEKIISELKKEEL